MHPVFFGVKRVHLRVVAVTRAFLRGTELTPARFDMLRIVALHDHWGAAQSKIQFLLGVSAPTVSRMLKSLETMGFVVRERMGRDARRQTVHLTRLGLLRLRKAIEATLESGVADRLAARGVAFEADAAPPQLEMLQRVLSRMRRVYGDLSPYLHPWRTQLLAPLL